MKFWPFGRKKMTAPVAAPCAELPVPTHLKAFFVPRSDKGNKTQITGEICCTCGCKEFSAHRQQDSNGYYHLTCGVCGKNIMLFDERQHGWDTLVCHMQYESCQTEAVAEKCDKCGCERFGATVWIEPAEKEEFVSCVEGELPDAEWVNAFTWFAAHLTCASCGSKQRDWADIETA